MDKKNYNIDCNVAKVLNIIGDKWTLLIIYNIMKGASTFKEIKDKLENIPTNLLSTRLKMLEENEIITSKMYSKHPPRYKYSTTDKGDNLKVVIYSLISWGSDNLCDCKKKMYSPSGNELEMILIDKKTQKQVEYEEIVIKSME